MNIHDVYRPFLRHFRGKRNKKFLAILNVTPETRILDCGGSEQYWKQMPFVPKVTLLNLGLKDSHAEMLPHVEASVCDIPFADESFDIVFSNSMIEHVGGWENQMRAAEEMRRVGKRLWIQTPYKWFPVEPHFVSPFIHWMPFGLQRHIVRFTTWAIVTKAPQTRLEQELKSIRLMTIKEMRECFPDCELVYERFVGLVKSIVAVKV